MYNEAQHLKYRKKLLQKNVALIHCLQKLMNYKLLILTQKHSLRADLLDKAEWQMMISPAAVVKIISRCLVAGILVIFWENLVSMLLELRWSGYFV